MTLVVLFLLLGLTLALRDLKMALLVSPLFVLSYKIQISIGSIPFTLFELYMWLLAVVGMGLFLKQHNKKDLLKQFAQQIRSAPFHPVWITGLLFIISTFSLFFVPKELTFETGIASNPIETYESLKTALGIWKGWILPSVIYALLVSALLSKKSDYIALIRMYVLSATVSVIASLMWIYGFHFMGTFDGRLGGVFVSANYLVLFIAPAFVAHMVLWLDNIRSQQHMQKGWHMYHAALALVLLVGIVLTRSYAAIGAIVVVGLLWSLIRLPKRIKVASLLVIVIAACGFALREFTTEKGQQFIETTERSSTSVRLELYAISLGLLKEHPLTGIGLGQYEAMYKIHAHRLLGKPPFEWVMIHPHNFILSFGVTFGLLGVLYALYLLAGLALAAYHKYATAEVFALLYMMIHGVVDTPFWKPDLIFVFFTLYFALSASLGACAPQKTK